MKNMINRAKFTVTVALAACFVFLGSCEEYLDKSPDAGMSEKELFKNFKNFQGFIEGMYTHLISPWNGNSIGVVGDEAYMQWYNPPICYFHDGNYWAWNYDIGRNMFGIARSKNPDFILNPNAAAEYRGIWYGSWYCIYLANKGLANLDKMYGTEDEKKVIRGQLLFFRAYCHFNIMQYWGGMPYIDQLYEASKPVVYLPRLKFQECADKIEQDLTEAFELLPLDWDEEEYGSYTQGNNSRRLTKFSALSVLGKCQLYAGSPLMNYESTGEKSFDAEYCKKAAATLKKVIDLAESTGKKSLQPWSDIDRMFFTYDRTNTDVREACLVPIPANTPTIGFTGVMYCMFSPQGNRNIYGCQFYLNLNYEFSKNFGMANGLPITEPDSGYDEADPWSNRDPRFDKWVCKDGDLITNTKTDNPLDQYAQFYTGGRHRGSANSLVYTGIGTKKFWDTKCNPKDTPGIATSGNLYLLNPPLIRLADVYLMYAEAVSWGYGSPMSTVPGDSAPLTAVDAVNIVRDRAGAPDGAVTGGMPPLDARYHNDQSKFFELLIQERAMELLFESQRFCDLRRWLRNSDSRYKAITGINFDRDPETGKPVNMEEFLVKNRVVDDRHNWLPLPADQVALYEGFYQNPGW